MKENSGAKPVQRISYSEKVKNKNEWGKLNIDHYLKGANFHSGNSTSDNKAFIYELHNNIFPENWSRYVTNPFNSANPIYENQPAPIRRVNIGRPVIEKLLGEYIKRPFSWFVDKIGEGGYNNYTEKLGQTLTQNLQQHFINSLDPEVFKQIQAEKKEVPYPDKLKQEFDASYQDAEAIEAQKMLTLLMSDLSFFEKSRALWKDFVFAGEEYSFKYIQDDEIVYQKISPLDLYTIPSYNSPYIEDADFAVIRMIMSHSEILDKFYYEITEKELDSLESHSNTFQLSNFFNRLNNSPNSLSTDKLDIYYVCWKSQKRIGFLKWTDETGQEFEDLVAEGYSPNKELGETVTWKWVSEVWEGYKLSNDVYLGIRPVPYQRNELHNISKCKLPVNGRRYSDTHAQNISIYEVMVEWIKLYVICTYRLERMIMKSKDKILLLDKAVIPDEAEWDEDKFFYYADTLGFALIDRSKIGVDRSFNQYTVLDMSLYQHIKEMIGVLEWIKKECYDTIGFSEQRLGEISTSATVTNTNNAIYASSVITEDLFVKHEEFIQRELQGLLDLSRLCYVDGKKSIYYTDDRRVELLNINPEVSSYEDLLIKVTNSSKQIEKLNQIKQSLQAMAQNGAKGSTLIEIIDSENVSKMKQVLKNIERMEQEQLEAQQLGEQEHQTQLQQMQAENTRLLQEFELLKLNTEYDRKEQLEYIQGDLDMNLEQIKMSGQVNPDSNGNGVLDINEVQKRAIDREKIFEDRRDRTSKDTIKQKELSLKEQELKMKDNHAKLKADTDKYKADVSLRIAKENKNKSDK